MVENIATYVGYLASVFIVGGFVFKDVFRIRLLNLIGCICFVLYGFLSTETPLYPIIIPNTILAIIQCYYLLQGEGK